MATITWGQWNSTTTTTGSTTASTAMWNAWNTSTSTATTVNVIWTGWQTNTSGSTAQPCQARQLTPEEQAAQDQRNAERREAVRLQQIAWAESQRKQEEVRKAADERAEKLLKSHLSGRQRRQYRRSKSFIVEGKDGHNYKIERAWAGHVYRLDGRGRKVERFCIHPQTTVPLPDNQLVAKLMLETNPEEFRRIANVTQLAA